MPKNKNALARYFMLNELLSDRHHFYSTKEMLDKVNDRLLLAGDDPVCRRTIEKDIEFIQSAPFNAAITRDSHDGKRYVRYTDPNFSIFTQKLSKDDVRQLTELFNLLDQFSGLSDFKFLEALRKKLKLRRPDHRTVLISYNPYLHNKELLSELFDAIIHKIVIRITYHSFKAGSSEKSVIVHPYMLKEYSERWYLVCYSEDKLKVVNHAVDRIVCIEPVSNIPFIEPQPDLEDRYQDVVGVTVVDGCQPSEIILWADDDMFKYLDSKPIHESQTTITQDDAKFRERYPRLQGGHFLRLVVVPNYELVHNELLRRCDSIQVLEPISLRNEIRDILQRSLEAYS